MFKKIIAGKYFFPILLVVVTAVFFRGLTQTFYQQDEWHGLGDILVYGPASIFVSGRYLSNALIYFLLGWRPFSVTAVALYAIFLHALNGVGVFFLAQRLVKSKILAFLAAVFFIFNGVAYESVTWPASAVGTLTATALILGSVFAYFDYLKKPGKLFPVASFLLICLSLFFKEVGIFLFVFYPLHFFLTEKTGLKKTLFNFWPFILVAIGLGVFRVYGLKVIPAKQDLFLTGASRYYALTLILRTFLYPLTSFSLSYFPAQPFLALAKRVAWTYYDFFPSDLHNLLAQTAILDVFALSATLLLFFAIYLVLKKDRPSRNQVVFWLGFSLFSFLPYVIVAKSFAYLESRYYYLAAAAAGTLFAYLVGRIFRQAKVGWRLVLGVLVILFIFLHGRAVATEIVRQKSLAGERMGILQGILENVPVITQKQIFYFTGDRNYYLGRGNPVPLQGGVGYTLLTWYLAQNKAPQELKNLLKDYFLWDLGSQGYRESDGVGFGYFWDSKELSLAIAKNKIEKSEVVGLHYDSGTKRLINITGELPKMPYAK